MSEVWRKGGPPYSKKEDETILKTIESLDNKIGREDFEKLSEIWETFFDKKRRAFSLFLHIKNLIKKYNLQVEIISEPKRDRPPRYRKPVIKIERKASLPKQLEVFLDREVNGLKRKAIMFMKELNKALLQENQELKEELRKLRPYKTIVDKHYRKEIENGF